MTRPLGGLFCPAPTPFGPDGAVDPDRLEAQVGIYAGLGIDGVVLFGTSGEGPLLDDDEESPLLAAARGALPDGRSLIAQVGRESVRAARAAARRAARAGADALLCLPPRYYPYGPAELADHYRRVAEATALPLLAYHIPQRTHVDLTADLLAGLAGEGVLAGIKDSSGDLPLQAALRERAGEGFAVLNGRASRTVESLEAGADGAILAIADAAPEVVRALFDAVAAGDPATARGLGSSLESLGEVLGPRFGVPGIKAALDLRGWPGGGDPRPPLSPLDGAGREEVAAALRVAGVDLS